MWCAVGWAVRWHGALAAGLAAGSQEVGLLLAQLFKGPDMLDLTFSDLAAGLTLVRTKQKEQEDMAVQVRPSGDTARVCAATHVGTRLASVLSRSKLCEHICWSPSMTVRCMAVRPRVVGRERCRSQPTDADPGDALSLAGAGPQRSFSANPGQVHSHNWAMSDQRCVYCVVYAQVGERWEH